MYSFFLIQTRREEGDAVKKVIQVKRWERERVEECLGERVLGLCIKEGTGVWAGSSLRSQAIELS